MGRWKGYGNHCPHKNNLIQDSEGNEENGYPDPDSNKTQINDAKDLNDTHKNILKEELLQLITENFMEMLLHMVNQNIQKALKKFQDTKNNTRRHRNKQMKP
jgi:predicted nucleotide-binding protein (sugar kinase/HSP70/actin superfamily)